MEYSMIKKVAFNYLDSVYVGIQASKSNEMRFSQYGISFVNEMANLGFEVKPELYLYIANLPENQQVLEIKEILNLAKKRVGSHVKYAPFYPNFPKEVMELSHAQMFFDALVYAFTNFEVKPNTPKLDRGIFAEINQETKIGISDLDSVKAFFYKLLESKDSIPVEMNDFVKEALEANWLEGFNGSIVFKETLSLVLKHQIDNKKPITSLVKNTTDVLRLMAALSDADVSLKSPVKFKSLSRPVRRKIVEALNSVINEEDVKRHEKLWNKAFHCLHIGEYKGVASEIADRFRNGKVKTLRTNIFENIKSGDVLNAVSLLKNVPSEFARNLDKLLRDSDTVEKQKHVVNEFISVIDKVSEKVLHQLLGHFKRRVDNVKSRVVLLSGGNSGILAFGGLEKLDTFIVLTLCKAITDQLSLVYAKKALLKDKKVFIADECYSILLPTQMASASSIKKSIARGSKIKMPDDKNVIRLFTYWKGAGIDIDISALLLNENCETVSEIGFYNLKNDYSWHSGDVRSAPNGDSEFIDVDINKAKSAGIRYVACDVRIYNSNGKTTFSDMEECFAGFMLRKHGKSGEIYEPKSVYAKLDLVSKSNTALVAMFDLENRTIIWLDLPGLDNIGGKIKVGANTLWSESNLQAELLSLVKDLEHQKVSVANLIQLHVAKSNAEFVKSKEEADFVVGFDGDLDPRDFIEINSVWI